MKARILSNREVAPEYFKLSFAATEELLKGRPGQFLMVRGDWGSDPYLRRPFSIYRNRKGEESLEIIYRVVGKGTRLLSRLTAGDILDVLGPLGNGFPDNINNGNLLLVSGGVGIAPLISLAESVGRGVSLIAGGRTKHDISYIADDVDELGIDVKYATEDGSVGKKGTSISVMREMVSPNDTVCACGPFGMLVEVQKLSVEVGFSAYVSYEEKMGCGVGLCFGCVVKSVDGGYLLVCKDGPVFDVEELSWDRIS